MQPPCSSDEIIVETVRFPAGRYSLEGELAYSAIGAPDAAALLAGPHPLLGGNQQNNVVRCLADGLASRGFVTLRFNYRGVGTSDGPRADVAEHLAQFWQTSHVPVEAEYQDDLVGAAKFLRITAGELMPTVLIGYSFGCSLLPVVAAAVRPLTLVLVAPTVGTHDYANFETLVRPRLVIAPEDDFAADAGRLTSWFEALPGPKELLRTRLDSHFFRGHESWLLDTVIRFLKEQGIGAP